MRKPKLSSDKKNTKHEPGFRAFCRQNTAARGIPVNFDVKFFAALREKSHCHYCRLPIVGPVRSHNGRTISKDSRMIDRKNPLKPHSSSNSFACCGACYFSRYSLHFDGDTLVVGMVGNLSIAQMFHLTEDHRGYMQTLHDATMQAQEQH